MQSVKCPHCGASLAVMPSDGTFMFCEYCGTKIKINVNINYNYSKSEHTERIIDEAKVKKADAFSRLVDAVVSPIEEKRAQQEFERQKELENQRMQYEFAREQTARNHENALRRAERRAAWRAENIPKITKYLFEHQLQAFTAIILIAALIFGATWFTKNQLKNAKELAEHQATLRQLEEERIAAEHLAKGEIKMPSISTTGDARDTIKALKDAGFVNIVEDPVNDLILGKSSEKYDIIEITVDGAPSFNKGVYYPLNVEIVVSYHVYLWE